MRSSDRVLMNTFILYGRVILTAGISLYTTRVVLDALGEVDYGIFNLVSGVVVMLSFLNNAMANSTQRFLSFYQGKNNLNSQKKIFSNSLFIHFVLAVILVVVLEFLGLFLFDDFLNIPEERVQAAKYVFHFMCFDIFFTIMSVPYNASLMAHENILWVAISNVITSILKLIIAYLVIFSDFDNLIFYGFLMACLNLTNYLLFMLYSVKNYDECEVLFDKELIEKKYLFKMANFAGWNLLGVISGMGRTQGLPIILNLFYGTKANASYGVSYQISGQLNFFSASLLRALNPQIMKSEGASDRERMLRISLLACKVGYSLLAIIVIPFMFEIDNIFDFWLKTIPEYAISYSLFILGYFLISQLTVGLDSAIQAVGDLKMYSIITGGIRLMTLPFGFVALHLGYGYVTFFTLFLVFEVLAGSMRVILLKSKAGLSIKEYVTNVLARVVLPSLLSVLVCILMVSYVADTNYRFLITGMLATLCFVISFLYVGFNSWEKELIKSLVKRIKKKIKKSNGV
ncbi:lipopolysaccharide biosynthesis protein [Wenyingzhuangia aestuarii]|uniref:lipopolysaccharide biosynthesis protein n=1 Tax=Wenyingzhuangia aestuarii TaxID=1647582 RepID=UPI00143A0127|nr:MATE family efflux transporter [Wenyingzhuangia aestuarii]NJB83258.1 O-antigen/teichoic acid export membrane protein [Wenyingzhuangia aestuarii]